MSAAGDLIAFVNSLDKTNSEGLDGFCFQRSHLGFGSGLVGGGVTGSKREREKSELGANTMEYRWVMGYRGENREPRELTYP